MKTRIMKIAIIIQMPLPTREQEQADVQDSAA